MNTIKITLQKTKTRYELTGIVISEYLVHTLKLCTYLSSRVIVVKNTLIVNTYGDFLIKY